MPALVTPYPWESLEVLERSRVRQNHLARRIIERAVQLSHLESSLCELLEAKVEVALTGRPAARVSFPYEIALELGEPHQLVGFGFGSDLVHAVLGRFVRQAARFPDPAAQQPALHGAVAALLVEAARRTGAASPLVRSDPLPRSAGTVWLGVNLRIGGAPFSAGVALQISEDTREQTGSEELAQLGSVPISVPVVGGAALITRAELAHFEIGGAFLAEQGLWLGSDGAGKVLLAAPDSDCGFGAELSREGKIMLRGGAAQLSFDGAPMPNPDESQKPEAVAEAALDAPLVLRIEIAVVSLPAREWLKLKVGDVLETTQRVGQSVVLRAAGKEVARGDLVNVDGQLGVRIRELGTRS